jgi:hypothetical protein
LGETGQKNNKKYAFIVKIKRDNQEKEMKNKKQKTGQKKRNENVKFPKREKEDKYKNNRDFRLHQNCDGDF